MNFLRYLLVSLLFVPKGLLANPPALHVVGNQIETVGGNCPVRLVGVDVDSLEWQASGQITTNGVNEAILTTVQQAITKWNANCVRIPLDQDWWDGNAQSTRGGTNQATYQGIVDSIVALCQSDNIYCDLDLQWSGDGPTGSATQQYSMPDQNSLVFWANMAARYANNTSVLFDTFNEPFTNSWSVWAGGGTANEGFSTPGLQSIVNTIRGTGALNICIAGGQQYSYYFVGMTPLNDPGHNGNPGNGIVYSAHIYNNKGTNNAGGWQSNIDPALSYGPVLVEEFGNSANTNDGGSFVASVIAFLNGTNDKSYVYGAMAWDLCTEAGPLLISDWAWNPPSDCTSYEGVTVYNWLQGISHASSCAGTTNTDTPTDTRSATPTDTRSATPTDTRSATPTDTRSATPTDTRSATPTDTETATATASSTASAVPSLSATVSSSRTTTPPFTETLTRTLSPMPSPSASATSTLTQTVTATYSPGRSSTPTGTRSASTSATPTDTPSSSPSATASFTASPPYSPTSTITPATATASPSATVSPTTTPTETGTVSATRTATGTDTASVTTTSTLSASPTNSATYTSSVSPTSSFTSSPTPTLTVTPSASPLGTAAPTAVVPLLAPIVGQPGAGAPVDLTLTGSNFGPGDQVLVNGSPYIPSNITPTQLLLSLPSQDAGTVLTVVVKAPSGAMSNPQSVTVKGPSPTIQGSGPLAIAAVSVIPNPNPRYLALDLAGPADSVHVSVYTKALVLALQFSRYQLSAGWNSFALPSEWVSLGSGMYYVQVSATRGQAVSSPKFAKALVLR